VRGAGCARAGRATRCWLVRSLAPGYGGAMTPPQGGVALAQITQLARPLRTARDFDPLLDRIGDARIVLLGEATHGTADFYSWRAALSQRLIEGKEFSFVAVAGDWPDCFIVNRWVKGRRPAAWTARRVLAASARCTE